MEQKRNISTIIWTLSLDVVKNKLLGNSLTQTNCFNPSFKEGLRIIKENLQRQIHYQINHSIIKIVKIFNIFRIKDSINDIENPTWSARRVWKRVRPKKSGLVSGNRLDENCFISYPPASVECVWEYISFVSEKHTHKLKYFHWRIYSYEFTFLPLQTKKDRVLCFSIKKSAVRVVF